MDNYSVRPRIENLEHRSEVVDIKKSPSTGAEFTTVNEHPSGGDDEESDRLWMVPWPELNSYVYGGFYATR
jgi:hypothetical protein